jgi:ABC transporter substrate binding protein/Transcription elongation factor, N-terminal
MHKLPMTVGGHSALEDELTHRIRIERPRLIQRIQEAIADDSNLAENSEYQAAKAEQEIKGHDQELAEDIWAPRVLRDPEHVKVTATAAMEAEASGNGSRSAQRSLNPPRRWATLNAFRQGLRELGYVEGQNFVIEYRAADGRIERFSDLADELARLKVDLILAPVTPAALAVKRVTTTIPVVVPAMGDPVGDGLVASLARLGGNITGLTSLGPELATKRLDLLKQALPNTSRVALLWHPGENTTSNMLKAIEAAARTCPLSSPRNSSWSSS